MSYRITEIFRSLQGEGRWTGRPATFVRFSDCNLSCPWCDTRGRRRTAVMDLGEIVRKVEDLGVPSVVVTGGEPTVQDGLGPLLRELKARGHWLALETNGLVAASEVALFDHVAMSPKAIYRERYLSTNHLRRADEVRVVAERIGSVAAFCREMRTRVEAADWYVSPLDEKGRIHYRRAYELMDALNRELPAGAPPWMLSIQTHKVLGMR